jgi:purine-nucleoside phosphorylase
MDELQESVRSIQSEFDRRGKKFPAPTTAVVLGSGLGDFAQSLHGRIELDSSKIPFYPVPQVEGHAGKLVFGRLSAKRNRTAILAVVGRSHFYESGDVERTVFPIRLVHRLGIRTLVLTNAAGGINRTFSPGDLMLINDHINMTFHTPAVSSPPLGLIRAKTSVYDLALLKLAREAAEQCGVLLKEGTYCGLIGPSYETAAEITMLRRLGADAVGMSTVLEALLASQLGMRVLGISLITNLATGLSTTAASHKEVIETGRRARSKFESLLLAILTSLPEVGRVRRRRSK